MKKNRYNKVYTFALLLNFILIITVLAQPYKYDWDIIQVPGQKNLVEKLYRVNLHNGKIDTVVTGQATYDTHFLNPSQTRLFLEYHRTDGRYIVVDPDNPKVILKEFNTYGGTISGALDGKDNKMYVSGWFGYYEGDTVGLSGSYVVDKNTLAIIDSTLDSEINLMQDGFRLRDRLRSFFSKDKSYFYTFVYNNKSGIYFDVASTITNKHIGRKQCGTLGGFVYGPSLADAKNGLAVISYETQAGFAYKRYVICDVDLGIIKAVIPFTRRANVYISGDTKYVLIEVADWDTTLPSHEYKPGIVFVHDVEDGKLVQSLKFPSHGDVFVFDHFPNMLYYYLENQQRSINIDLSKLSTITSINPETVTTGSNNFTLTVNGKNFLNNSTVYINNNARTTTYVSDTVLQANILSSDVTITDTLLVTVKNILGDSTSTESNPIKLYITPKQENVDALIDSLRIRLQKSFTNKWIGNQQWVNELDKHLQNAKKQYAKGEKQSPIEQLEVFCKQIKNEYESKNKNRWITKDGFEYLYPYAQNVIEKMRN